MSIQAVQQRNFCHEIIQTCTQKISEIAEWIRSFALRIFQTLLPCCCSRSEPMSVTEITEGEIQDLAEHITSHVMERLGLGILGQAEIPGQFNTSVTGEQFPEIGTRYDPNCPLIQRLKPLIANTLRGAFANGDAFAEGGVLLILRSNEAASHLPQDVSVQRILDNFQLETLGWHLRLQLNRPITQDRGRIYFDLHEFFNGENVSHKVVTVDGARDAVRQRFLSTYR